MDYIECQILYQYLHQMSPIKQEMVVDLLNIMYKNIIKKLIN